MERGGAGKGGRGALGLLSLQAEAEPRVTPLQRAPPSAPQREKPFLVTLSRAVSRALFFGLREPLKSR